MPLHGKLSRGGQEKWDTKNVKLSVAQVAPLARNTMIVGDYRSTISGVPFFSSTACLDRISKYIIMESMK